MEIFYITANNSIFHQIVHVHFSHIASQYFSKSKMSKTQKL
jgi:hypothetical protein